MILAAGASTRMGDCKALIDWGTSTLVGHVLRCVHEGGCSNAIVVVAKPHAAAITQELTSIQGVTVVTNSQPERGMLSSLQEGLLTALELGSTGILFAPVDLPISGPETVRALLARQGPESAVLAAAYQGQSGHPVWVSREVALALATASLEFSARHVMRAYPTELVSVDDPGVCGNLNTPADAARWQPEASS